MITLSCWVYGDENYFCVDISREKTVHNLKQAIIAELPNCLRGIDAHSLNLWKVDIDSSNKEELRNVQWNDDDALDPAWMGNQRILQRRSSEKADSYSCQGSL